MGQKPLVFTTMSFMDLYDVFAGGAEKDIEFGAQQCVVVRNDAARMKLPLYIRDNAVVLTPSEAKGLEFDDVLLYNFFTDSEGDATQWNSLAKVSGVAYDTSLHWHPLDPWGQHLVLESELKMLYVALTRARTRIFIFDESLEKPSPFYQMLVTSKLAEWHHGVLGNKHRGLAEASDEQKWHDIGSTLLNRAFEGDANLFSQAATCFKKIHESKGAHLWCLCAGMHLWHQSKVDDDNAVALATDAAKHLGASQILKGIQALPMALERANRSDLADIVSQYLGVGPSAWNNTNVPATTLEEDDVVVQAGHHTALGPTIHSFGPMPEPPPPPPPPKEEVPTIPRRPRRNKEVSLPVVKPLEPVTEEDDDDDVAARLLHAKAGRLHTDTDGDTRSVGTAATLASSTAAKSVATEAFSVIETNHALDRCETRGITRRELQSAKKKGTWSATDDGKVKIDYNGLVGIFDKSKCITTWRRRTPPTIGGGTIYGGGATPLRGGGILQPPRRNGCRRVSEFTCRRGASTTSTPVEQGRHLGCPRPRPERSGGRSIRGPPVSNPEAGGADPRARTSERDPGSS